MAGLKFVGLIVAVGCIAGAHGLFDSLCTGPPGGKNTFNESWNDLRVNWDPLVIAQNLIPNSNLGGRRIKRNIDVPEGSQCVNEVGSATFYGHRVSLKGDPKKDRDDNSVVVLYDKNGMIAGIQARFPYDKTLSPTNTFKYTEVPMFQTEVIDGDDYFVLTAYFVDPQTICDTGRTTAALDTNFGTGDSLWFQNGPTPADLIPAPKKRADALAIGYSDNKCFEGMGTHSFYKVELYAADNCNSIVPMFLLYNKADYLIGFGFSWTGRADSKFFEKPPAFAVQTIVGEMAPKCLIDGAKKDGAGENFPEFMTHFRFQVGPSPQAGPSKLKQINRNNTYLFQQKN